MASTILTVEPPVATNRLTASTGSAARARAVGRAPSCHRLMMSVRALDRGALAGPVP
jgi:hypothetical protein